jgi:hypothetical protein
MLLWTAPMAVLAVIVGAAPLGLVYDALGTSFLPAVAAGTGMIVWAASPSIASLTRRTRARLMSAVAAVALVVAPFTVAAPAHDSLRTYVAEGEEAKTTLATFDRPPAALAALFPKRDVPWPWASEHAPTAPAGPMAPEPSPTLELLSSEALRGVGGSSRRVVVKLRSSRGASIVGLAVHAQVSSSGVVVHGEPLGPERANRGSEPWRSFECVTTPPEGLEVDLTLDASGPVEAYVYDRTPGLPEGQPQKLRNARPPTAVPVHFGDVTVVARRVEL